jgi:hypothetical protein
LGGKFKMINVYRYLPGDVVIYNRKKYHVIRRSKIAPKAIRISEKPNATDDNSLLVSESDVRPSLIPRDNKHGI